MSNTAKRLNLENAQIMYRNFKGEERKDGNRIVNNKGSRNFCVILNDAKSAKKLAKAGWNVKVREDRNDPDAEKLYYLPVAVNFNSYAPPRIYTISGHKKTRIDEDTVSVLDGADIVSSDLIINPYDWEVNGNHGRKAYLRTMYVTLEEDEFAHKYEDYDDDEYSQQRFDDMAEDDDVPF